ncbi:uncharacterized protein [Amphiura filiformis]|uniref:uncharacterized protein n=1 Tax=Amphiura filiformis TaxID=82378 RepID=UPI003B220E55
MSAAALMSLLYILSIFLVVESCMKITDVHTTHGFPIDDENDNTNDKKSRPVPPHPFRKRSVDGDVQFTNLNDFVIEKLHEIFDDLDKNHDGKVTVTEWVRRKAGISEYSRILNKVDTNEDRVLSFDEFLEASTYYS